MKEKHIEYLFEALSVAKNHEIPYLTFNAYRDFEDDVYGAVERSRGADIEYLPDEDIMYEVCGACGYDLTFVDWKNYCSKCGTRLLHDRE